MMSTSITNPPNSLWGKDKVEILSLLFKSKYTQFWAWKQDKSPVRLSLNLIYFKILRVNDDDDYG